MQALRPASRVLALRAGKPAVPLTRGEWITAVFQGVNNALHSSSTVTRETFTHRKQTGKLHQIILTIVRALLISDVSWHFKTTCQSAICGKIGRASCRERE